MRNVVIGIINKDNKLLMVKRVKKDNNLNWVFPGGKIEINETKENACIREVFEETGINVSINEKLCERNLTNENTITYFLCNYQNGEIKISNKNEIEEIAYKSLKEFNNDIKSDIHPKVLEYIKKNII